MGSCRKISQPSQSGNYICIFSPQDICAYKFCLFVNNTKINQEEDADAKSEQPNDVGLIFQCKTPNSDEEDASDKVDEELQLGDAAADEVVEKDAWDDDGIADNDSLQKYHSK